MMTNLIPITQMPPLYPQDHVDTLLARAREALPHLSLDGASMALRDLFAVHSITDLVDKEGMLSYYEYQPCITRSEMSELVSRITPFLTTTDRSETSIRRHATWVIRNIINCVPAVLDDLVDYLTKETLFHINLSFSPMFLTASDASLPDDRLYDMEIAEHSSPGDIDVSGTLAMMSLNKASIDTPSYGLTKRQQRLTRAAEYYVLHRYGYAVASLWLSKFICPSSFCRCSDSDCEGRHFGFIDADASYTLVIENLDYIHGLVRKNNAVAVSDDVSMDDIVSANARAIISAMESAMLDDQGRTNINTVATLMDAAFRHKEHLEDIDLVKLSFVSQVAGFLYGDGLFSNCSFISQATLDASSPETLKMMDKIGQEIKTAPAHEYLPLFDAHNFMVAGIGMDDFTFGRALQIHFLASIYDAEHYASLAEFIKDVIASNVDEDNLVASTKALFNGFIHNYSTDMLARGSCAGNTHMDALFNHCGTDAVIQILSELGHRSSMIARHQSAKTPLEARYWSGRISTSKQRTVAS